ncbi:Hpt domain-containing protein [Nitratiruptor sp. YY09-18]|uniref:Hpt domain-containing protein n=1 Tax=Nitratiruptor sp. YY09-18 TaxID=2724901 RepID=UPI00191538F9|nr:Hpt domain-containing protein [Nitratiruptor sp. YY09-18]BCD67668.1 hypothetical protein NitYY0918_C0568 [Nitratiruptor sp. YY09-18]
MILYDAHKKLIAISDQTLEMLGFTSLEEFKKEVYDVAQLFLRKPGYIHEFRSFHWIDYILTNNTVNHRALIQVKDGRVLEIFVKVNQLNNISQPFNYYLVTFELNAYDECTIDHISQEQTQTTEQPKASQATASQTLATTITITAKEVEKPAIDFIAQELNLGEDIVEDFIKEYINHALEQFDEIQDAVAKKDRQRLYNIIHTLKGVAANLRLKPAFEILAKATKESSLDELLDITKEYYAYMLGLAKIFGVEAPDELQLTSTQKAPAAQPSQESTATAEEQNIQELPKVAAKELGLSMDEYQEYLKELINEIKLNLAYNNYNELHKLASFARNLYLQECAKYLDQVSINQNPELVKKCINDLEQLKKEPNPFIVTPQDLEDSLQLIQIEKDDFVDIVEDLVIELKTLNSIKMRKEKFLKKAKQLKSIAESLRLSNLVLLLNNIISNYPMDKFLSKQLEEAIESLEASIRQIK